MAWIHRWPQTDPPTRPNDHPNSHPSVNHIIPYNHRVVSRDNGVSIRWVPAHHGALGDEKADEYAKAAAEGVMLESDAPDEHRWVANLAHMTP